MKTHNHNAARAMVMLGTAWLLLLGLAGCPEEPPPPPACPVGTADCPCDEGSCQAGLECRADRCQTQEAVSGLNISAPSARACEVLIGGVAADTQAEFASSIEGRAVRQGDRLALAFHAREDASIAAGATQLVPAAGAELGEVQVVSSRCFDGDGAPIAGAEVTLVR